MDIASETLPNLSARPASDASRARFQGSRADECDRCGRAVHRGTAVERIHRGDDGIEVVVLCRECEFGTD